MDKLTEIYNELYEDGVFLFSGSYELSGECDAVIIHDGNKYGIFLDIDKARTTAQETVAIAHEYGHYVCGAFYTMDTPLAVVRQAETRADKRAITRLVPKDELDAAVGDGRTELWELAEFFGVTEPFMQKAINWYKYGTLAV